MKQEYWVVPSSTQRIKTRRPALQGRCFTVWAHWETNTIGCLAHLHLVKLWYGLDLTYHLATHFLFTLSVDSFSFLFYYLYLDELFLWVHLSLLTSYLYFQAYILCESRISNIMLQIFVFYRRLCVVCTSGEDKEKRVMKEMRQLP